MGAPDDSPLQSGNYPVCDPMRRINPLKEQQG
jgi:hypothetical protein